MAAIGYHFSAKVISRTRGQSAVASAAYRTRSRLEDERYGKTHDYRKREGLEMVWHTAPKDAPTWARDVGQAWNAVEQEEKRINSTLAREYVVAFPHQLTAEQREWMLKDFIREELTRKGLMVTAAIHAPSADGDERNYHAHIMFSDRPLDADGFAKNKDRSFTDYGCRAETLEHGREKWAQLAARQLERGGYGLDADRWRHGHEKLAEQVTAAEARGDIEYATLLRFAEAGKHLGAVASVIERDGRESRRGAEQREIEAANAQRADQAQELEAIRREIAALEMMAEAAAALTAHQPDRQPVPVAAAPEVVKIDHRQEERQRAAAAIREAWNSAERDPVSFAIGLGEQGLTLAENDKGRFVAVDERGAAHYLTAAALGEKPITVQRELAAAFKSDGGVSLPSVDEVRAELKEQREAERAFLELGNVAHLRAEVRQREANREIWKEQRQLDREIERIEAAQERPQNKVMELIGRAWADSSSGAEFVDELEYRGLIVCRVTAEEAQRSQNQQAWLNTPSYQEGEYLAVTEWGATYRLNAETIALTATNYYDHLQNVTDRLAEIEPDSVVTYHEAQEIVTEQRAEQAAVIDDSPIMEIADSIGDGLEAAIDMSSLGASKSVEIVGRVGAVIANGLEAFFFGGASRQAPGGAESNQEAPPQPRQQNKQKQEITTPMKEAPAWMKAKTALRTRDPELATEANTRDLITNHPLQVSPEMYEAMRRQQEQERSRREW